MKYLYLAIIALVLGIFESSVGVIGVFAYIPYTLFISILFYWLINRTGSFILLGVSGLLVDLVIGNWLGTLYLSFFLSLLLVKFVDSFISLETMERKFIGSTVHFALSIFSNYFLILLKDNTLSLFRFDYLLTSTVISLVIYIVVWILISSGVTKGKVSYG